jgi:hypothetical protein
MADDLVVQGLLTEIDLYRWISIHALAERDDALWALGKIDQKIRSTPGEPRRWYEAVCYASAMCERALAGSKRIKEDE